MTKKRRIIKRFVDGSPSSQPRLARYLESLDADGYEILEVKQVEKLRLGLFGDNIWEIECLK